ncbi:MAG: 3-deoxy-D-manno-octulosonic acid transferase [Planctomycetes bacterium]|nr:3-deoxy-D-manno-octulosonic acid transferase [Planctomycetota bacterium]
MSFIINIIYILAIIIVLPYYLVKFITTPSARMGLWQRFGFIPKIDKPSIWLHGASVGELKSVELLIEKLLTDYPDYAIVLSSLTPTAQSLIRKKYPNSLCIFFPIDLSWVVKRALRRINPRLIILLEQEIWPNFIRAASGMKIPVLLLNARITEKSFNRYSKSGLIFKPSLAMLSHFGVQDETYAQRYAQLNVPKERITVTGNMKYDMIKNPPAERDSAPLRKLQDEMGIRDKDIVLIAGSTSAPEEEILLDIYSNLKATISNLKLILAPRHPERFCEVESLIKSKGFACLKRSKPSNNEQLTSNNYVIFLDTMGELSMIYSLASIVFVGGSLIDRGGQNMLEPAALGKPVIFGSFVYNFRESADLLVKAGAGFMVKDKEELLHKLKELLSDLTRLKETGKKGIDVIASQQGATEKNLAIIKRFI